jgi:hypothetical protein
MIAAECANQHSLARDMTEVHGIEAAAVARGNASAAARGGQVTQAKSWIKVLGIIQRLQEREPSPKRGPGIPPASSPPAR